MLVFMIGMWGMVHACCSMAFPLVLTAPVVVLVVLLMGELFADTLTKTEASATREPPFWLMCQQKRAHSHT